MVVGGLALSAVLTLTIIPPLLGLVSRLVGMPAGQSRHIEAEAAE